MHSIHAATTDDLTTMKERAAADPGRRRSMALRDQADMALLRGDIPASRRGLVATVITSLI